MKLCYKCYYDGGKCDKAIPKFVKGSLVKEKNTCIKERFKGVISEDTLNESWDACQECKRNHTISGFCNGILVVEEGNAINHLYRK